MNIPIGGIWTVNQPGRNRRSAMKQEVYKITGMSCAACSSAVERVTRRIEGVARSDVNLTTARMQIEYDEAFKYDSAGAGILSIAAIT